VFERGFTRTRLPAGRELALSACAIVGLSRLVDGPVVWLVALLLLAAMLFGSLQVLADADPNSEAAGVPVEALLTPSVAAVACLGAIRLVPAGLWLVPALAVSAWLVERTLATEVRLLAATKGPSASDRSILLVQAVVIAFLAFAGVASIVPGGLAEPAGAARDPLPESDLVVLVLADALVAGLLGYRASALRLTTLRDALWSAASYASVIAIGAAAIRAMAIPRLVGPAILTLLFFLWDAFHGAPPSRRRDPAWLWQTVLLAVLGLVVLAWNLRLR
jgi:hypothetical protein